MIKISKCLSLCDLRQLRCCLKWEFRQGQAFPMVMDKSYQTVCSCQSGLEIKKKTAAMRWKKDNEMRHHCFKESY